MSRREIFEAVTKARGRGFTEEEVPILDVVLDRLKVPRDPASKPAATTGLKDEEAFWANLRKSGLFVTGITQAQVDGIKAKLAAFGAAAWPLSYAAYAMATSYWETAQKMQPVREAFWKDEAWRKANLRYWPWYGRGDVQLTWKGDDKQPAYGYTRADKELGLGGALTANPDRALEPDISARIMVKGMEQGWFTSKKLADYLPTKGPATFEQFKQARRIINGVDKWTEIANIALRVQAALQAGGWG